jgi:hypothetical protein
MALTMLQRTINAVTVALTIGKKIGIREFIDDWVTQHNGVIPDQFLSYNALLDHYTLHLKEEAMKDGIKPGTYDNVSLHYRAHTWLYSRYTASIDPRIAAEVVTTPYDGVFHGEIFRRLPHWTTRFSIMAINPEHPDGPLGMDMMLARAIVDGKDAMILGLSVVGRDSEEPISDLDNDSEYFTVFLDLDQPTVEEAMLSLEKYNINPDTGTRLNAGNVRAVESFLSVPMFVCSQLPPQSKSQGRIQHQSVKVKRKGKRWVLQPAAKLTEEIFGSSLADLLEENPNWDRTQWLYDDNNRGRFIAEWVDTDTDDPTFFLDWIPPEIPEGEKKQGENPPA